MHDHYSSERIPAEIAENLKEFTEHDDLSYEEFLMQQVLGDKNHTFP